MFKIQFHVLQFLLYEREYQQMKITRMTYYVLQAFFPMVYSIFLLKTAEGKIKHLTSFKITFD